MKKYILITLIVLPIGFGIGLIQSHFTESKCPPNPYSGHHWDQWQNTGRTAAWPSNKMLVSRQCVHCGFVETKNSN